MRDARYKLVRPKLASGEVKCLQDIARIVTKTTLAKDLGKNSTTINRLLRHTEEFRLGEIVSIGFFCRLSLRQIVNIAKTNYSYKADAPKSKSERYADARLMHKDGDLPYLRDIVRYIHISEVANDLGIKRQRLSRLLDRMEGFQLKELTAIGDFCNLTTEQNFSLIASSFTNQKNKKYSPEYQP